MDLRRLAVIHARMGGRLEDRKLMESVMPSALDIADTIDTHNADEGVWMLKEHPDPPQAKKSFTLRLSPEAVETLDWIARERGGATYAEVIRRALGTERFLMQLVASGASILVEKPGQRTKELIFR